jgi:glycosyltransferase involved in cell wall biosynthesis
MWSHTHVAEQIQHRVFPALRRCAAKEPADLYIGHYPAGLAAAGCAAEEHGALLGYDAEDFHVGQQPENQPRIERTDFLERRYVEKCAHVTAASEGIAEALAERYGIDPPQVIHNMFPWAEREKIDGQTKDREGDALSLYWFSQTVGLDRGLQDAIRAAGLLDSSVQLHIRGTLYDEVERELKAVAAENGVAEDLYFHPKVPPGELLSRTAEHDIGLALEEGHTPNRRLCVTNKLFYYPLGGLAIIATDVEGQRRVLEGHGDFSGTYESGDAQALARLLQRWTDSKALDEAQSRAMDVARTRWNWENEREKLVGSVRSVLREKQSGYSVADAPPVG